jgi:hypothetical protein
MFTSAGFQNTFFIATNRISSAIGAGIQCVKTAIKNRKFAHYFTPRSVKNKARSEIAAFLVKTKGY